MTFFSVMEAVGYVEFCASVSFPEITCPIDFPFEVGLLTADGTAGRAFACFYEKG